MTDLVFNGPAGSVRVINGAVLADQLGWFLDWPFAPVPTGHGEAAALRVDQQGTQFRIIAGADAAAPPEPADGPLAAAHLLADAVTRTYALHVAAAMLVHAAAIGIGDDQLVLLIGDSGAGKSTFAMVAASHGLPILADDRLAILPHQQDVATGLGLMPKLRRPLPDHLSAATAGWIDGATALTLPEVIVLHPPDPVWWPALTERRIAGVAVLDRQIGASPALAPLRASARLRLWLQHSAMAAGSGAAHLARASALADVLPMARLIYSEADAALAMLPQVGSQ